MSKQWDAKFAGVKRESNKGREQRKITVFAFTREEAIDEVVKQAGFHGYDFVTIDHIARN